MPGHAFPPWREAESAPSDDMGFDCTLQYIRSTPAASGMPMATGKTRTLTFRIEPGLTEALRTDAARDHRPATATLQTPHA